METLVKLVSPAVKKKMITPKKVYLSDLPMDKLQYELFNRDTQALVYGLQAAAVQRMLDFDFICQREKPSVAAIINPTQEGLQKVFWGGKEILIPVYQTLQEAVKKHQRADVLINFASLRSAYPTTIEALNEKTIRTIVIIAEGVPERRTRELTALAKKKEKIIIGPATVGGIKAGAFKIGNTAGTIDNIISSKLHRPGCVGFVSKSGGMSNEMYNVIAQNTNGLSEGIAIGGDRYPGTTLLDHLLRYEANPEIKMLVALGEVGGVDEYEIVEALKTGEIKKPLVIWVTGTCAKVFPSEVQFGHAGAKAEVASETAEAKNQALKEAGAFVPKSFDDFGDKIRAVYQKLKKEGKIPEVKEPKILKLPLDFGAALKKGLVRRSTNFTCTISDDRGEEATYGGIPISEVVEKNYGLGEVIALLWFKKKLPRFAAKFIEMVLLTVADHGPAVSGAHNAIVAARAGKDLVSALCSGLLTIGPRFGGAIDGAAYYFKKAKDSAVTPAEFVKDMKAKNINIPGIGHLIKSIRNPDKRVEILKKYARENFPKTEYLNYALEVEKITTAKRDNLILNVDGCIGILFLDLMKSCPEFTQKEIDEVVEIGYLNGLFVLGRSIGFMGHIFDQKRMKERLYRHPWDDILYL